MEKRITNYDSSQIKVLKWLEPVRHRPWMYIGSTDTRGLHHMVYEIVDNAVDEALAGHAKSIIVRIHQDWYVSVEDDGRWIPVDIHPETGKSALEAVFTILHAGGKFEKWVYKISWGLHWVGASVVNALSDHLIVQVYRDGKIYQQEYERGVPIYDVKVVGETSKRWTFVKFKPDSTIFETIKFSYSVVSTRLRQAAYLTPGIVFTLVDERVNRRERFFSQWWIIFWLSRLTDWLRPVSKDFYISGEGDNILIEIAFKYTEATAENIFSFVNNIPTPDGWTHVNGFKSALLRAFNEFAKSRNLIDKKLGSFQLSDILEWLYAIVTVKIPDPQFEWQTKGRLGNAYVKKEVDEMVFEYMKNELEQNEDIAKIIIEKIKLSAKARLAAKLARETVMRKSAISFGVLPWKLTDCSIKKREGTEMFIVEGDSAWGTAKQARDSSFQAILPLRGKILNTEQASLEKIMANNEIKSLIIAIGAGIRDAYDENKLRYDKIILMTDADVDGAHIRTLLLTFFFRYMRPLIENEHLYIAISPLYKITQGKKSAYIYPPVEDLDEEIKKLGFEPAKIEIQRYKGLGEMNADQLWETTMDSAKRRLQKVTIADAVQADKLFRVLMGEEVSLRKNFILTHAKKVKELDI